MGLILLYAALIALIVWSVGYLVWRLFRALHGAGGCGCGCGCDCAGCAGRGSCGKR